MCLCESYLIILNFCKLNNTNKINNINLTYIIYKSHYCILFIVLLYDSLLFFYSIS